MADPQGAEPVRNTADANIDVLEGGPLALVAVAFAAAGEVVLGLPLELVDLAREHETGAAELGSIFGDAVICEPGVVEHDAAAELQAGAAIIGFQLETVVPPGIDTEGVRLILCPQNA